ncbi:MAG: sulfatase-like hydrolase/transferase [Bryobacteraceae bacterium]|nr:sulfatase-like hydrolase/transferase [Bryobacteraceae bacterium]
MLGGSRFSGWRHGLAALSLANLCLLRIWVGLLGEPVPRAWYAAALLNLLLLSLLFWTISRFTLGRWIAGVAGLALITKEATLASGQDALLKPVAQMMEAGLRQGWLLPAAALGASLAAWLLWRLPTRWILSALLILSPVVAVTAGPVAWRLAFSPAPPSPAFRPSTAPGLRHGTVVWILFDELDERVAFTARPAGLRLPALDAFRAESVVFREARSPANSTAVAIPLMLGNLLERPGLRTGLIGWYLPYCQTYPALASCQAWPMDRQRNSYGHTLGAALRDQLRSFFESSLYSVFGQSLAIEAHVRTILAMEEASVRLVQAPGYDLVFLHLPTPHSPYVYDAARGTLSATNQDARGYLGNLQVADRLFAKVRESLERAGRWRDTHVIVTGDHGYRQAQKLGYPPDDLHVPWLWKPPGESRAREVRQPFATRDAAAFVGHLLDGDAPESVLARYP